MKTITRNFAALTASFVALWFLAITAAALANTITVNNNSFEVVPAGGFPFTTNCVPTTGCSFSDGVGAIPDWTNSSDSGEFIPGTQVGNFFAFNTIPDGNTVTFANAGTISQTVGATVQAGVIYTLRVDLGWRNDYPAFTGMAALLVNGTQYVASGVTPVQGGWSEFTATYTGLAADAGDPITIQLNYTGTFGLQADFDNVRLSDNNHPPVANAGPDQTVKVSDTVHLTGAGSSDVDGDPLTFHWSFLSAPAGSAVVLSDSSSVTPTFLVEKPGAYVVQLVVNDGTVDSAPAKVTITTTNSAPVANAGPDQTVKVGDTVHLDGSKSSDVDGDRLTFRWSLVSAPTGSSAALSDPGAVGPTFVADKSGSYVARLIVNDGAVDSAPADVKITTENTAPVADARVTLPIQVGDTARLDGSHSSDADGDPLNYRWALTVRPAGSVAALSDASAISPTFVADKAGTYVAQLIVNDGKVDSQPSTVTIKTENTPPVADAGPNQTVSVGAVVQLNGGGSHDADGDPLTYRWALTVTPSGSAAKLSDPGAVTPTFIADKPGTYVAQLIVNDGAVDSPPATVRITTQNSPPVADAGKDQSVHVTDLVTLDGGGSHDVDGDPLTYKWSLTVKPSGSKAALSDPAAVKPTFQTDQPGTFVAQLIVNDGTVDSPPATVKITVTNDPPVAVAGPDLTITLGKTARLDGSASRDPDNGPSSLTFHWRLLTKPSASKRTDGDLVGANTPIVSFTPDVAGKYTLSLTVSDGLDSSTAQATVTVVDNQRRVDLAITKFEVPKVVRACDESFEIEIVVRNLGTVSVKGDVILYKNGKAVKVWKQVRVGAKQKIDDDDRDDEIRNPQIRLEYRYDPDPDAGKTVVWTAKVIAAGDQDLSNNSAGPKSTTVKNCEASIKDGTHPEESPIQGTDGNFYGTTFNGGDGPGTVFKITP